jgi:hypothetical protein
MDSDAQPDSLENPVIVFDTPRGTAAGEPAIVLQCRQPSFTFLGIRPTAKGFQSLSDFHEHLGHAAATFPLGAAARPSLSTDGLAAQRGPPA